MSFSLQEILCGARSRELTVSPELAGFLSLAVAEQLARDAHEFDPARIRLEAAGTLTVNTGSGDAARSEVSLRHWLGQALLVCPADHARLRAVSAASAQGFESLCTELRTALVPLNRGAARRALGRLFRRISELPPSALLGGDFEAPAPAPAEANAVPANEAPADASKAYAPMEPAAMEPIALVPRSIAEDSAALQARWTPIFGSLLVEPKNAELAPDEDPTPFSTWRPSPTPAPVHATPTVAAYVAAWTPLPPALEVKHEPSVVIEDRESVIVSENPRIFDRFAPRRSNVEQLLGEFGVTRETPVRRLSRELQEMAGVDRSLFTPHGPAVTSRTPPPVDYAPEPAPAASRRGYASMLGLTGCAVLAYSVWSLRSEPAPADHASGAACQTDVEVQAQPGAEIRWVGASRTLRERGPLARFEALPCDEDAELIVVLAEPAEASARTEAGLSERSREAASPKAGWMRVPVPSARLHAAARSGEALVISVFGH